MLYRWNITIPKLSGAQVRRAYLYLPRAYYEKPDQRFPVLYMFDGHNVFLDSDATYGTSWGMLDYLNRENPDLIVAAVSCNTVGNGRLIEYSPYPHHSSRLGFIPARGEETMNWLLLKQGVDLTSRIIPGGTHCEASWRAQMPIVMRCLGVQK